jgi:light-regulated signal transduction histidine kinase (bacteriophytochrome)
MSDARVIDHVEAGQNATGEAIYTQTRKIPLRDSKGTVVGLQGIVWDVTDFKQAEDQLRFLNKSLEACVASRTAELATRNAELEQRNIDLDQYAYIASHDLQEPLRKLISFSQLLEQDVGAELGEAAQMDLFYIKEAARRMQQLVLDLLAFSRAGRAQMSRESVPLDECVDRALEALAVRIQESSATIQRMPLPQVCGDPTALAQLYQNLVGNALKFIRGRQPVIRLTAQRSGNAWTLGVSDNGIGIEPQYVQQIFAPFKRLHNRSEFEGTGIGLAICQTVVERHGGRIWVESELGIGSCFKFNLPAETVAPAVDAAEPRAELLAAAAGS